MRLVHLTDIHLSKSNHHEFEHKYKDALIKDLLNYHSEKPIDLILITGDLVDKGGHSLFEIEGYEDYKCPYDIFEEVFIDPISEGTGINKNSFLFVPGNHDVNEKEISYYDECRLTDDIDSINIETYLHDNKSTYKTNKRIKQFKDFERKFHENNDLYNCTNNHSIYVHKLGENIKVGFLLINDSWRCKTRKFSGEDGKIFFGFHQLDYCLKELESYDTELNICLFHHPISDYKEETEVERIIRNKNIELYLYGHYHSQDFEVKHSSNGSCFGIRGRAALNKPEEKESEYQSGYQIIDIDILSYSISKIHYRKYIYKNSRFDYDAESAMGGVESNFGGDGFKLHRINKKSIGFDLDKDKFWKE